jgi:hypothetical protein
MPTIGLDCHLILDGAGYWTDPVSYSLHRPRVRAATHNRTAATIGPPGAGVGERYVDMGPGKREWKFTIPAFQAMRDYAGRVISSTGQAYRDSLHASYNKVNTTLSFTDPQGAAWTVRFDDLLEDLDDIRSQADGQIQYFMHVTLVEA